MANEPWSLTYLGRSTPAPATPDEAVLDRVPNAHTDTPYAVRFSAPEFTVLCAVTGQPDFAHVIIDYVPKAWLLESKSLKFYLSSFRNHRSFHEECTIAIGKRITAVLSPVYLRIGGYWYPRGGIPIDIFWEEGRLRLACGCPIKGRPLIGVVGDATAFVHRGCDVLAPSAKCPLSGSRTWRANDAGGSRVREIIQRDDFNPGPFGDLDEALRRGLGSASNIPAA